MEQEEMRNRGQRNNKEKVGKRKEGTTEIKKRKRKFNVKRYQENTKEGTIER
jgi:hypothetical protein